MTEFTYSTSTSPAYDSALPLDIKAPPRMYGAIPETLGIIACTRPVSGLIHKVQFLAPPSVPIDYDAFLKQGSGHAKLIQEHAGEFSNHSDFLRAFGYGPSLKLSFYEGDKGVFDKALVLHDFREISNLLDESGVRSNDLSGLIKREVLIWARDFLVFGMKLEAPEINYSEGHFVH